MLADDRVRYMGDAIAAVFAETEAAADAALATIAVTYRDLPVLVGYDEALKPDAIRLHGNGDNTIAVMEAGRGDVEAGFAAAALVMDGDYETQYIEHAYLEPESCVATVGGRWQPHRIRGQPGSTGRYFGDFACRRLAPGKDPDRRHAHGRRLRRQRGYFGSDHRRPWRFSYRKASKIHVHSGANRSEPAEKRHATRLLYKTGVSADGLLTAIQARIQAKGGAYASVEEAVILRSSSFAGGPYTIPAADIKARAVYQNHAPVCAMRGFGNPVVTFAAETSMNRIADALKMDPIELRLKNALEAGKPTLTGDRPTTSVGIKECLLAVQDALKEYRMPEAEEGWASGIGIACSYKNVGLGIGMDDSGGAEGEILENGDLLLRVGSVDMGQGSNSAMAQILSARLGWPFKRIKVHSADSQADPLAGMTTASRQTFITGNAVLRMADSLKDEIGKFIARGARSRQP